MSICVSWPSVASALSLYLLAPALKFEANFNPTWHEIKTWSYLEFNYF